MLLGRPSLLYRRDPDYLLYTTRFMRKNGIFENPVKLLNLAAGNLCEKCGVKLTFLAQLLPWWQRDGPSD